MTKPAADCGTDALRWVAGWIAASFGSSSTEGLYRQVWIKMTGYFVAKGITALNQVSRQTCYDYLLYREGVSRNRVIVELRVLSSVLSEAVRRGIIDANPAIGLRIKKGPPANRPEIPDSVMAEIADAIERDRSKYKHFLRVSFAIAKAHGVRIRETRVPMSAVDFASNTITFLAKGARDHVVPIHPSIRPMLEQIASRGDAYTFAEPSDPHYMSQVWQVFFKRHGFKKRMPKLVFHCHRNTVITKLARANVSEAKARRYVAHSTTAVHAIYQKIRMEDLGDCVAAL